MRNKYEVRDDVTAIFVYGYGKFHECLIDTKDLPKVQTFPVRWFVNSKGYVCANPYKDGKRALLRLHRVITDAQPGADVDHRDGDTLNNRRHNLLECTHAQNMQNQRIMRTNTSGVRGVTKRGNKWLARIGVNGKLIRIGLFDTVEEAAEAVTQARVFHHPFSDEARHRRTKEDRI